MDIWEYKVIRQVAQPGQPFYLNEGLLQQFGDQGWELVNVVPVFQGSKGMGGKFLVEGSLYVTACDCVFKRKR